MELRHAFQFASRTARLALNNTSQCRAINNPARFLSTTRALLADDKSSLPPRPPATKTSWLDLPASSSTPSASSPTPTLGNPWAENTDILSKGIFDMDFFNKKNNIPTTRRPVEMRNLRPSTGRTVERTGTVDVARAFALLQQACGKNKVQRDFSKQRFHERPGLKRKRLKSERWRARFKVGFRATVKRVQDLRAQGW